MLQPSELLLILGVSVIAAIAAVLLFEGRQRMPNRQSSESAENVALLFDDEVLHHATQPALTRFALFPGAHVWDDLRAALLPRFPDFPNAAGPSTQGSMTMRPDDPDDPSFIEIAWRDGMSWVALHEEPVPNNLTDTQTDSLVLCCETMPTPAWETGANGSIAWRNAAYQTLAKALGKEPHADIFEMPQAKETARTSVRDVAGNHDWYEITTHRKDDRRLHHAVRITPLVQSETAQRNFVHALAKTFAHLSIGLAIFDRDGRLSIFNPALVDLTRLQPGFLAGQPDMLSFFDQLRENRGMPEPKDYVTWRQQIAEVIAAASGGQYRETWTLEDGRTFAVQGRPHPGGATAFLIEDISPEITLTRNFRTEMMQYEVLLDTVETAMVVFSASGILTFCNAAYRKMWSQNPESAFADVTVHDAVTLWRKDVTEDTPWESLLDFVTTLGQRSPRRLPLRFRNGKLMDCELVPISSDATLVRFVRHSAENQAGEKAMHDQRA